MMMHFKMLYKSNTNNKAEHVDYSTTFKIFSLAHQWLGTNTQKRQMLKIKLGVILTS